MLFSFTRLREFIARGRNGVSGSSNQEFVILIPARYV